MGYSSMRSTDWDGYTSTARSKTADELFKSRTLHKALDPKKITVREARDSDFNPESTPVMVCLDVTGSMGRLAVQMAQTGLGTLAKEIIERKPVSDPQLMFVGVGDADYDSAPLQPGQFEADLKAADQLSQIYIEHGGGGNRSEGYNLPWYFGATKTQLDCVEKGRRKGLLFTIGDEEAPPMLTRAQVAKVFGEDIPQDLSSKDVLAKVEQTYDIFHVIVEEGDYCSHARSRVFDSWNDLIGQQRVIPLADHTKLSEVIIAAIEVNEGRYAPDVAASFSGSTSLVVAKAVKDLVASNGVVPATRRIGGPGAPGRLLRFG